MRSQKKVSERERMESFFGKLGEVDHVAERFRYLFLVDIEELMVHPESGERPLARCDLGLRYFVVMVRRQKVDAAGVDVYLLSKRRVYHGRAFDMPAREAFAPWAIPSETLVGFPQKKIRRAAFIWFGRDACARFQSGDIDIAQLSISRKARRVVVDAILSSVGVPFFLKCMNERYLTAHVVGCAGKCDALGIYVERFEVRKKLLGIPLRERSHIFHREFEPFALERLGHFVWSRVCV